MPVPREPNVLDAGTAMPEPGVELRSVTDRAGFDVHHYEIAMDLTRPESGAFEATATLLGELAAGVAQIDLDFVGLDIRSVMLDGEPVAYGRGGSVLSVGRFERSATATMREVTIIYGGEPENGLFFGEDANGDPAIFADNWPNRARWWFPSNDHPSDKATVRFEVMIPDGFAVIANGTLSEIQPAAGGRSIWIWESDPDVPIPSYAMVIGVARFDRRALGPAGCGRSPAAPEARGVACADVSVWALAGDGDYGAARFSRAQDMLDYYSEVVGPYPYEKLAHVESSTQFGGMENASAIFYGRGGWEGRRMGEGVIAHETAHQWFGDAVSPASWYHLWVSEGFASYFSPLYFEARDGVDVFQSMMRGSREVATGSDVVGQAIVDSSSNQLFDLLNRNNYQKGAWVLHMLRQRVGDDAFFRGIEDYYARHLHSTAETEDVRAAFERTSGLELSWFFDQWVYSPGHPQLEIVWTRDGDDLEVEVTQIQSTDWPTFVLDFELEVDGGSGDGERVTVNLATRIATLRIPGAGDATGLVFDPSVAVLATADIHEATGAPDSGDPPTTALGIPLLDLSREDFRRTVVDREPGQYLGHPTTQLLEDGHTLLAVYPKGHGRGPIVYKRSVDGGYTWSDRLRVPASWATSREVPTLYRIETSAGDPRLLVFSGLYPIRLGISDDEGASWSDLRPIGEFGGIVAMASLHQQADGDLLAFFHDDGRFLRDKGEPGAFSVYATRSADDGTTWSEPWVVASHERADLCEPGLVQSPDGEELALLLRENSRTHNSFAVFSTDDGDSWGPPRELPPTLTGDRHTLRYAPDGRIAAVFRDMAADSPTRGDWVLWVGTWEDIREGAPGQYRVRLMDNTNAWDAAYPGLELLPDGTFVSTTYGHWIEGEEPFVVSVHFTLAEIDARIGEPSR